MKENIPAITIPKCTSCPECGDTETKDEYEDITGPGYRICASCCQEWWVDIDYKCHINKV